MEKGKKKVPANFHGKKGRSGRRKLSVEIIAKARELHYEELAKEATSRHLQAMVDDEKESNSQEVKDIALPIVLKGIKETKEIDFKDTTDDELAKNIAKELADLITDK